MAAIGVFCTEEQAKWFGNEMSETDNQRKRESRSRKEYFMDFPSVPPVCY